MDNERKFVNLMREIRSKFFDCGVRWEPVTAFPGWTPDATPEEEADIIRAAIEKYAAERGIAEIPADAAIYFTLVAQYIFSEYRSGAKKAPVKAATLTRAGT